MTLVKMVLLGPDIPAVHKMETPNMVRDSCTPEPPRILRITGMLGCTKTSLAKALQPDLGPSRVSGKDPTSESSFSVKVSLLILKSLFSVLTNTTDTASERSDTTSSEFTSANQCILLSLAAPPGVLYIFHLFSYVTSTSSLQYTEYVYGTTSLSLAPGMTAKLA
ncbi:hypothetical protein OGATHE_003545 [Ogataea polymorpha]|uniref:Uncharacterized protein n=1 Tax=Ogataea polymorpha TaxID=460523 RepID=A0A9P8T463_9ASCO|nr:hypothetical protein OGATHE_003545 [Ogataea polymorpha]